MLILTLRTDKPEAEIGLFDDDKQLAYFGWPAHRQLAETVHLKIKATLKAQQRDWPDLGGLVVYKGPGSFTGLRIGIAAANALSVGLGIPIVAANGAVWAKEGIQCLLAGKHETVINPEYGAVPHVTKPVK